MASVLRTQMNSLDTESLVAGVLLAGVGVGYIYLENQQLGAFDYFSLVLGLCMAIFYLTVIERYSNSSTSRRIMEAIFMFVFIFITTSTLVAGSSLLIGSGIGFLIDASIPEFSKMQ